MYPSAAAAERQHAKQLIAVHQANLTTQQTSLEVHKRFLYLDPITRRFVQGRRPATLFPRGPAPEVDGSTEETDRPLAPRGPQSVDGSSSEEREFPVVPRRLQTGQGTASDGSDEPLAPPKARSNNNKRKKKKSSRRPTASKKRKTASGEGESHQSSSFAPRRPLSAPSNAPVGGAIESESEDWSDSETNTVIRRFQLTGAQASLPYYNILLAGVPQHIAKYAPIFKNRIISDSPESSYQSSLPATRKHLKAFALEDDAIF
ncbi:hypothetical protein HDU88_000763 [Geranomyces variabilis]|nr:hypothetical protein HDU88_000763 [Geranomyces variabilis]